jgi:hypothetical protein
MTAGDMFLLLMIVFGAMVLGAPIALITLAAGIYAWTHAYPWLKMVGKWAASPANFIALVTTAILFFLVIALLAALIHQLMLVLIFIPLIILFPVMLAVVVWIARLIKFIFTGYAGFIEGIFWGARLQIIRLKIKTDTFQETGFRGFKEKDKKGKKELGFAGKLDTLKGEFSGDFDRIRGRLSRRK